MMPSLNVAFPLHLVNNCIQAKEAPLSQTITKKNDVNKVDASNLGMQCKKKVDVTQAGMFASVFCVGLSFFPSLKVVEE